MYNFTKNLTTCKTLVLSPHWLFAHSPCCHCLTVVTFMSSSVFQAVSPAGAHKSAKRCAPTTRLGKMSWPARSITTVVRPTSVASTRALTSTRANSPWRSASFSRINSDDDDFCRNCNTLHLWQGSEAELRAPICHDWMLASLSRSKVSFPISYPISCVFLLLSSVIIFFTICSSIFFFLFILFFSFYSISSYFLFCF